MLKRKNYNDWTHEVEVEVTESEIRLTLSTGDVIAVDKMERTPGVLSIHGYPCSLDIQPRADNAIYLRPRVDANPKRHKRKPCPSG